MDKNELKNYTKHAKTVSKDELLIQFCSGKDVLDVGCIGQDRDFSSPEWLHNKIKKHAKSIDGVDILTEQIAKLKLLGYSMFDINELLQLQKKYDVVLMSDVIEHVDDPVDFIRFYAAFLTEDGVMCISTPNSNRADNFIQILFNNNYSVNPEHVFWFCPRTFSEVVNRAGLCIRNFFWAYHYFSSDQVKGLYSRFKFGLVRLLNGMRSNFRPNMIFILTKNNRDGH